MKVKINQAIASPVWSYKRGQIVDMETRQADAWIKSGLAAAVAATPAPNAATPTAKPRAKKG